MTTASPQSGATISDQLQQVRGLINVPRKQHILLEDLKTWNMLTSSMDVIEDTEMAIDAYLESIEEEADDGILYLAIYGILQVLFVQQDAVAHLSESLGYEYKPREELKQIREIRNASIGHPTKRGRGENLSFHFITRVSMSRKGFRLMSTRAGSEPEFSEVDVLQLISEQRGLLRQALSDIIAELGEEELNHRQQFRKQKLKEIFGSDLHYNFEKIGNAVSAKDANEWGVANVDQVLAKVEAFKSALEERGLLKAHSLEHFVDMATYSLMELRAYVEDPSSSRLSDSDAEVFYSFARRRLFDLVDRAGEFDTKYESDSLDV